MACPGMGATGQASKSHFEPNISAHGVDAAVASHAAIGQIFLLCGSRAAKISKIALARGSSEGIEHFTGLVRDRNGGC